MTPEATSYKDYERENFFVRLLEELAREAANRDHDAAELIERTIP